MIRLSLDYLQFHGFSDHCKTAESPNHARFWGNVLTAQKTLQHFVLIDTPDRRRW
ncbi:hypothetical protein ACN4EK_06060 [Pantanalinema rosaneae CENA516]|uniref:hypothetical protein n=1 Tax=Pantanalinema rosaneae TaxID=1620701 RepID=UPI003D6E7E89